MGGVSEDCVIFLGFVDFTFCLIDFSFHIIVLSLLGAVLTVFKPKTTPIKKLSTMSFRSDSTPINRGQMSIRAQ